MLTALEYQNAQIANPEHGELVKGDATTSTKSGTGMFKNDKIGPKVLFTQTTMSDGKQFYTGTLAIATHEHLPNGGD